MEMKKVKFIQFAKVDATTRQVWGIVTAEVPDKDKEVCDYAKSKPYYEAVIAEMAKATDDGNFFPLREMHQLVAVGKCVGFDFRDADREIFMGFKVTDDKAWKKVEDKVYTGFSQGGSVVGEMVPDPVFKGCTRYVANPSEVSLVDNPCLATAHFTYVKADGSVELRKFKNTIPVEPEVTDARVAVLEEQVATLLKAAVPLVKGKTKRVGGEDLASSAFAYVGSADDPKTWKLPIKFSSDQKTKRHLRNALARFGQTKGIPSDKKDEVHARILAAAKQHGIDVEAEKAKLAAIQGYLRKRARATVNRLARSTKDVGHTLSFLDNDLGKLSKGMYEVSRLAQLVESMSYMLYGVIEEQRWEGDMDSALPEMLAEDVDGILDTLLAMVAEEAGELRDEVAVRVE